MPQRQETPPPLVFHRIVNAPRERVFRAWTDRADLERWYSPEDGWPVRVRDLDARVGGGYVAEFGPPGDDPYIESAQYLTLDPPRHLEIDVVMTLRGQIVESTHCTVDFLARGRQTEIVLTETGFNPDMRQEREGGWGRTLDHLVGVFA